VTSKRLFYNSAYTRRFTAQVVDRNHLDGKTAIALDQTAFFPASGGQPADTGLLDGVTVSDVHEDGQIVWHLLEGPLPETQVQGEVDWRRRWDHMQNHSGQHVLSQSFVVTADAETVAWHLSNHSLTIDLDRADLQEGDLFNAEQLANQIVQENRPITARWVEESELPSLALRKQPAIDGPLRIVEIADFDRVACSGTHVGNTAEIGLIKVLRAERRGTETRIHFLCGGRALADYTRKHDIVRALASRLTRGEDELLEGVSQLEQAAKDNHRAWKASQKVLAETEADRLWHQVQSQVVPRWVIGHYQNWESDQIKQLALTLRTRAGLVIALTGGSPPSILLTRSDDVALDVGQLVRDVLSAVGGRGGGRPDYAQGRLPDDSSVPEVLQLVAQRAQAVT
jgi:alanyl-tRNA synthetase